MRGHQGEERFQSLSLRRAWIEMRIEVISMTLIQSLSLRRAWIEMGGRPRIIEPGPMRRSPYGERGLK